MMGVLALLLEDEFPDLNMKKVLSMCLLHDLGEIGGDIPAFRKNAMDAIREKRSLETLIEPLPEKIGRRILDLQEEFDSCDSPEARLANALDKIEAVIQHNNASLSTWSDLEYDLNMTYGEEFVLYHPVLKTLREAVNEDSIKKVRNTEC